MSGRVLVFVEDAADELSQQAVVMARSLGGDDVQPVSIVDPRRLCPGRHGPRRSSSWRSPAVSRPIVAPGSERGNEILAHVAAKLDQPMAANCTSVTAGDPATVTRVRWGGIAARGGPGRRRAAAVHQRRARGRRRADRRGRDRAAQRALSELDQVVRVTEQIQASTAGVSLTDADVVVSGGRGVGSAEGFSIIEELADLLGGAVGCSRAVTSAGWRPHSDQVGQTGSKVSPEIYIACGISGATQHMAGIKGAKRLLAINPDGEASIFAGADYAVIGDLHEVVPAISAEIRKARGS